MSYLNCLDDNIAMVLPCMSCCSQLDVAHFGAPLVCALSRNCAADFCSAKFCPRPRVQKLLIGRSCALSAPAVPIVARRWWPKVAPFFSSDAEKKAALSLGVR